MLRTIVLCFLSGISLMTTACAQSIHQVDRASKNSLMDGVMQTHNIGADQDIGGILLGTMVRDTGGQGVVIRAEVIEAITTMQVPLRRPRHRQPMRRHSLRSNHGWLLR